MKKVLVTGADGFIGSHLVELLFKKGYKVKAFCIYNSNNSNGWIDTLDKSIKDNIEIINGDVRDFICVRDSMKECEIVFHLAALISIPYSYKAPKSYIETNITGTFNVLQSARELKLERVIHTSTSETYGTAQFVPINESHPLVGQSPYAASKIGADQIALSYWRSFDTPVSVIRPFNTYGPRQSTRAVIPTIISQIASGKKNICLGALSPTRDFNFVEDICKAFIAISESEKTIGKVINAASNFEISIGETLDLITDIMNTNVNIITEEDRLRPDKSEVNRLYGDNSLLFELTKWDPKFIGKDGFRRGLKLTIDWFCEPNNLKYYNPYKYSV